MLNAVKLGTQNSGMCQKSTSVYQQLPDENLKNTLAQENTKRNVAGTNIPDTSDRGNSNAKWRWIGHTLMKLQHGTRLALHWNPQGHGIRGRPRMTWRRSTKKETELTKY